MCDPQKDLNQIQKESPFLFFKLLPIFFIVVVVLSLIGFTMYNLGMLGQTEIEHKIVEDSTQPTTAIQMTIANEEELITKLEGRLMNPKLDQNIRFNLNTQIISAQLRINSAKRLKK